MFFGFTIDPVGSHDRDDAISLRDLGKSVVIEIAFPDLTAALPARSPLDLAAAERGTSRYGGRGLIAPMLDGPVTEAASLNPGRPRPVFVLSLGLTRTGQVETVDLRRDRFESRACLTYAEATAAMRSGHDRELALAWEIAQALYRARRRNGALAYYDLARGIATNEEGTVRALDSRGAQAEVTVAEFMILANTTLAALAATHGLPILYRNHRARPAASRDDLVADLESDDATSAARRAMVLEPATLESVAAGHYALHVPAYAWFTSPLRRYADLVNQRALGGWLDGAIAPVPDLAELGARLTAMGREAAIQKAEALKARDKARHRGLVGSNPRRIAPGDMSKVIALVHEHGGLNDDLERELLHRIRDHTVGNGDYALLLGLSPSLAKAVIAHLRSVPGDAMMLLNNAKAVLAWPEPDYKEQADGPAHQRTFHVSAGCVIDARRFRTPTVTATTLKAARAAALIELLAAVAGLREAEAAPDPTAGQPASPAPTPPAAGQWPTSDRQNAKAYLQELCQLRKWPLPLYEGEQSGPPHKPSFQARVAVETSRGPRSASARGGTTRKDAEKRAAAAWLSQHTADLA